MSRVRTASLAAGIDAHLESSIERDGQACGCIARESCEYKSITFVFSSYDILYEFIEDGLGIR